MAFKSYEELTTMASTDPNRANALIARAQKMGKPVVSSENSGYGKGQGSARMGALKRSMQNSKTVPGPTPQDEIVKNRKTGY